MILSKQDRNKLQHLKQLYRNGKISFISYHNRLLPLYDKNRG